MPTFLTCQVKRISIEAGLPNITGDLEGNAFNTIMGAANSAIYTDASFTQNHRETNGNAPSCKALHFDASRSSSIYGSSNNVIPRSQSALWCVKY